MCGRFVITSAPESMRKVFKYSEQPNFPARYNVAPTQPVPVVMAEQNARHFRLMRWGFLPSWAKDPAKFGLVINARGETLLEKPAFKNAIRRRRCLLPADGYYEWQTLNGRKQPYFIRPKNGGLVGFAGVVETWTGPNGEEVDTVAIITCAASNDMAHLHARSPVVIAQEHHDAWLDAATDVELALELIRPPNQTIWSWYPVSAAVNRVANDDASLLAEVTPDANAMAADTVKKTKRKILAEDAQGSLF